MVFTEEVKLDPYLYSLEILHNLFSQEVVNIRDFIQKIKEI